MSKVYEVYYCYHGETLMYIGQGIKGRHKHCDSGCSHVYGLNKLHFLEGVGALEVRIVKVSGDKKEVERLEREAISCLKPKLNSVFTEKNSHRNNSAKESKNLRRDVLEFRDRVSSANQTEGFICKYKNLCEDFFCFYGYSDIISGNVKLYSRDAFKEFGESSLMYLSRYLRKPNSNYELDNNPYALFCRAIENKTKLNLANVLHTRTSTSIV